jgi:alkyl hydroperoxide reductase subunit AhpC
VPALDAARDKFAALDVQVLDISIDTVFSHKAWQKFEIGDIHIPMCSDFYPHGQVTEAFGIMRQGPPLAGISERAVFIVDKAGKIAFAKVYPLDQSPKAEELLEAVSGMKG